MDRSKRSSVDLNSERGRKVVFSLVKIAGVIFENYRDGAFHRLGFGDEVVKAVKPDIIYALTTG